MKFTIERAVLLKAMALANSVIERRNTIPVLSNVALEAKGEILRMTATDLDIEIAQDVAARVDVPGKTTVEGSTLYDIARKLPDGGQVEFEAAEHHMAIKSGRSRFKLQTLPFEDFPDFPREAGATRLEMPAAAFHRLFAKTIFCVSTEETRYYLNGIYLHADKNRLSAVATDGHRLAKTWVDSKQDNMPGVIVPRKTCALLVKHLDGIKDDVRVSISPMRVIVEWGAIRIGSKVIDGQFPDYERVVPRGNQNIVLTDVKTFQMAVDRVGVVSGEKGRATRFTFEDNKATIVVNDPNGGTAVEEIDAEYSGPALEIGFNNQYVLQCLGNLTGSKMRLELADAGAPAIVKSEDGDQDCFSVLMPMRV